MSKVTVILFESFRDDRKDEFLFMFDYEGELLTFGVSTHEMIRFSLTSREVAEKKLKDHMIAVGYATEDSCIEVEYG